MAHEQSHTRSSLPLLIKQLVKHNYNNFRISLESTQQAIHVGSFSTVPQATLTLLSSSRNFAHAIFTHAIVESKEAVINYWGGGIVSKVRAQKF